MKKIVSNPFFFLMCCLINLKLHMGFEHCHRQRLTTFDSFIHCLCPFTSERIVDLPLLLSSELMSENSDNATLLMQTIPIGAQLDFCSCY